MTYPKMLRSHVLVKTPKQTKSKGGIELPPDAVEEKKMAGIWGEAVAVGKECEEIKVGDKVLPKAWVGNAIEEDDYDTNFWYLVIDEADILCKKSA